MVVFLGCSCTVPWTWARSGTTAIGFGTGLGFPRSLPRHLPRVRSRWDVILSADLVIACSWHSVSPYRCAVAALRLQVDTASSGLLPSPMPPRRLGGAPRASFPSKLASSGAAWLLVAAGAADLLTISYGSAHGAVVILLCVRGSPTLSPCSPTSSSSVPRVSLSTASVCVAARSTSSAFTLWPLLELVAAPLGRRGLAWFPQLETCFVMRLVSESLSPCFLPVSRSVFAFTATCAPRRLTCPACGPLTSSRWAPRGPPSWCSRLSPAAHWRPPPLFLAEQLGCSTSVTACLPFLALHSALVGGLGMGPRATVPVLPPWECRPPGGVALAVAFRPVEKVSSACRASMNA